MNIINQITHTTILNDEDWKRLIVQLNINFEKPKNTKELKRLKELFNKYKDKGISL